MLPWCQSGYTGFLQRIRRPLQFLYWSGEPGPLFEACVRPPPKCTCVFSSERRSSFQYLTNKRYIIFFCVSFFALCERKKRNTDKMASTMLPQAKRRLCAALRKSCKIKGGYMRLSTLFGRTLRDAPAEAENIAHQLVLRAALVRPLLAGGYTLLPQIG